MFNTIIRNLTGVASERDRYALWLSLASIGNVLSSQALTNAGLVIGSTTTLVKTGASVTTAIANGHLVSIPAASNFPAPVGSVPNGTFNIFTFTTDQNGVLYTNAGTGAATLGAVQFPQLPIGQALLGFVIINPTGTGTWIGGTTAFNDATTIPNTQYISTTGAWDPTIIVQ